MSFAKEVWTTLAAVDVGGRVNKKGNMSYLSWAWAWGELMNHYPESNYKFLPPVIDAGGTVEVWCDLTISEGEQSLTRSMWLPVMDYKNSSVVNPTSREVSDNRMRCLVKAIAMFGLGHYIYAGEDLPDEDVTRAARAVADEAKKAEYDAFCAEHSATIEAMKLGIESGELSTAKEAWDELSDDEKTFLWKAPSKGGVFTTIERSVIQTTEFKNSILVNQE